MKQTDDEHPPFSAVWGRIQDSMDLESISLEPSFTIRPPGEVEPHDLPLPELFGSDGHVALTALLGRGGMGQVHLATQAAASRDVAVKILRPDIDGEGAERALLREALIHARLEHPNIVPVHMVGKDEGGRPVIVMKKVEGTAWSQVLRDPNHPALPEGDPLAGHLSILMQVCRAAHYAHSRGIVHRDIKPHNVMIGAFGEVYLLDWGLALPTSEEASSGLPTLQNATTVSGTPAYMAPEMLEPAPWRIDARTDVYLIGAVLHQILTGTTRHQGKTVQDMLRSVHASEEVTFPPSVPTELAEICNRATHAAKSRRYSSADDLRRAVAEFLTHRESARLESAAFERLQRFERALQRPSGEHDEQDMYADAQEARFGFRAAIAAWPENTEARAGLERTLRTLVEWALAAGNLQSAQLLFTELDDPDPELGRRIESRLRMREERDEELQTLRQEALEFDPLAARRARGRLAVGLGALWLVVPLAQHWMMVSGIADYTYELSAVAQTVAWTLTGSLLFLYRRILFMGKVNRRLMWALLSLVPAMALGMFVAHEVGVTALQSVPMRTSALASACLVMGVAIDSRMFGAAAAFALATACSAVRPDLSVLLQGLGNMAALASVGIAWTVGQDPIPRGREELLRSTMELSAIPDPYED